MLFRQFAFFGKSRTGGLGASYSVGQNTVPNKSVIDNMILAAYNAEGNNPIKSSVLKSHIDNNSYTSDELNAISQYFQGLVECDRPIYSLILWRSLLQVASSPFVSHPAGSHWSSSEYSSGYAWYVSFSNGSTYNTGTKLYSCTVRPSVAYVFNL